jgi:divalent metal cation (Fe/Co/Zn/Cd) transporter
MEIYFWTFVVALLVLLAGGAYSVYQGLEEFARPTPIRWPELSLAVLFVSALFEGASFRVAYREYRKVQARHRMLGYPRNVIQFIKWSKDPSLYESLLEDGAALVGVAVAAIGIVGSAYLGIERGDGAASLLIGLILLANGTAILIATRSLMAGEAVAPPVLEDLWAAVRRHDPRGRVTDLATLHLGPSCIFIAVTLAPPVDGEFDGGFLDALEHQLKDVDERVLDVFFHYT